MRCHAGWPAEDKDAVFILVSCLPSDPALSADRQDSSPSQWSPVSEPGEEALAKLRDLLSTGEKDPLLPAPHSKRVLPESRGSKLPTRTRKGCSTGVTLPDLCSLCFTLRHVPVSHQSMLPARFPHLDFQQLPAAHPSQ